MKSNNGTSEKIITTALNLFSEKGYYSTTIKQIAQEAGFNELTIFRHFGSKAQLFQAATEYTVITSKVDDIFIGVENLPFDKSMDIITKRMYNLYIENTKLYKIQMKLSDDEDFIRLKLSRKFIEVLEIYFRGLKLKGEITGEPKIMAVTLINSVLGAFTIEILTGGISEFSWEELIREHTKQFTKLYG